MKLSSLILGIIAIAIVAFAVWSFGPFPARQATASGASVYDPATEIELTGVVKDVRTYACPESGGEMGGHLTLQTPTGVIQVHLAPSRLMRSRNLAFAPGDQITVFGSEVRVFDRYDVIARVVRRDGETVTIRDAQGKLIEASQPLQ